MESDPDAAQIFSQILILFILTLVNAFFAGAEMAVVSVSKNRIHKLAEEGNKKAALIERLMEDSTTFLSTIQVAITFAGFFSSASAATGISQVLAVKMKAWGVPYSQGLAVGIVTIILSYFTLVFGELIPKRIALQKAEWFSLFTVRPVYMISKVLKPFIKLLSASTNGFLKLIGMKGTKADEEISEEEVLAILEIGNETGVFNDMETSVISSVFMLNDRKVKEIMVTRQDMTAIDLHEAPGNYIADILRTRHSRIPVYEEDLDHVVGILSMKDYMIEAHKVSFEAVDIAKIMQKPYFVPENQKIDVLFKDMQKNKISMAVLVDEYGGVSGIVTMEDLIEEVVGDIYDEYDESEAELKPIEEGLYEVSGQMLIYDLNEELDLKIKSQCDTLSGYLIEHIGHIPAANELPVEIEDEAAAYQIITANERVVQKVQLRLKKEK